MFNNGPYHVQVKQVGGPSYYTLYRYQTQADAREGKKILERCHPEAKYRVRYDDSE
jgi:hypothetical protein